jgi:hypothetical protein
MNEATARYENRIFWMKTKFGAKIDELMVFWHNMPNYVEQFQTEGG